MRVWQACTGYWRTKFVLNPTVAGQVWYATPAPITSALKVTFNLKMMGYASIWDLDYGQPNWEKETTVSGGNVPDEPAVWTPAGVSLVAIWPADAAGGNSLTFDGLAVTPVLTADADFVDMGSEELNHILDYVEHVATFKQGGAEFEATRPLLEGFLKGAAMRNAALMASSRFRKYLGLQSDFSKRPMRMTPERVGAR